MKIYEKLLSIQSELKVNKSKYNSFGKYYYRSCEDILEALKPLCAKYRTVLTLSDTVEYIGDRYYVKAIACLHDLDTDDCITNSAYAREEENRKGMSQDQITGSTSTYARKYCVCGLFSIDDNKDSDSMDNRDNTKPKQKLTSSMCNDIRAKIRQYGCTEEQALQYLAPYASKVEEIPYEDYHLCLNIIHGWIANAQQGR